jgi:hypothetical protein
VESESGRDAGCSSRRRRFFAPKRTWAGYLELYRRRLLPGFDFINRTASGARRACVTIPGMGCGQFAGRFRGRLGEEFRNVLETLLAEHGDRWPNIGLVRFDP